jgi:DUF4097 and DUF4098 domain-containing protein YvlB
MLVAVATLAALGLGQQFDTTVTVPAGTRLDVSNPSGSIVVKAWTQKGVRVHADHDDADQVQVTLEGSVLRVKTTSRRSSVREVSYIISVPAAMPLTLSGVKTGIDVDGTQAAVTVETVNGQVNCRGGSGLVSLKSVDGNVAVQQAKGRIELNTVNDDISASDISGDISASTVSGDIELRSIESSNVEAATVSGEVEYEGSIADGGRYHFATHNGDVTLAVPEKANATISVSTFNGDLDASFPVNVAGASKHRFSFGVGTAGTRAARIDIETFNGDIKLRRPSELDDPDE